METGERTSCGQGGDAATAARAGSSPPRPKPSSTPATASLAARAALRGDREFWQFHRPEYSRRAAHRGCRGEGPIMRNSAGRASWSATRRAQGPRAARLRLALHDQGIKEAAARGQTDPSPDMTHLGGDTIRKRLPSCSNGHNFATSTSPRADSGVPTITTRGRMPTPAGQVWHPGAATRTPCRGPIRRRRMLVRKRPGANRWHELVLDR